MTTQGFRVSADRPIAHPGEDLFSSRQDADRLAGAVVSLLDAGGRTTVGLLGPWGSGKTGVLNLASRMWAESGIAVVQTAVWAASLEGPGAAAKSLHYAIASALNPDSLSSKPAVEAAAKGAEMAQKDLTGPAAFLARLASSLLDARRLSDRALSLATGGRVVVVVDDVDRLSAESVRELFSAISAASLTDADEATSEGPSVCFVLALDEREVAHSVQSHLLVRSGHDYLEKLINVPVTLSLPSPDVLTQISAREAGTLVGAAGLPVPAIFLDGRFRRLVRPMMSTPRDMRRFLNLVAVTANSARVAELNAEDYLTLSVAAVFDPEFYGRLRFQGSLVRGELASERERDRAVSELRDFLEGDSSMRAFREQVLAELLPDLDRTYGLGSGSYWVSQRPFAFANPEYFDRYFHLSSALSDVADSDVEDGWSAFMQGANLDEVFGQPLERAGDLVRSKLLRHLNLRKVTSQTALAEFERVQTYYSASGHEGLSPELPGIAASLLLEAASSSASVPDVAFVERVSEPAILLYLLLPGGSLPPGWQVAVGRGLRRQMRADPLRFARLTFLNSDPAVVRLAVMLLLQIPNPEVRPVLHLALGAEPNSDEERDSLRRLNGWLLVKSGSDVFCDTPEQLDASRRSRQATLSDLLDEEVLVASLIRVGVQEVNAGDADFGEWLTAQDASSPRVLHP